MHSVVLLWPEARVRGSPDQQRRQLAMHRLDALLREALALLLDGDRLPPTHVSLGKLGVGIRR